jgi:WD40 repeat protein
MSCLGITRDSQTLTIAGSSRGAQYDLATGRLLGSFALKESVDFSYVSPSGHFLVGSGYLGSNGTYFLYRVADKTLRNLGMSAYRIVFTSDDRLYATTTGKEPIRVYEAVSGKRLFEFPYEEESTSLTFSADGRLLASVEGKHIRVFDMSSGQTVARIEVGPHTYSISFSEDLTRLYTVELWEAREPDAMLGIVSPFKWEVVEHLLSTPFLIDENCRRLTRNLTREEWNLYLPDAAYRKTCPLSGH